MASAPSSPAITGVAFVNTVPFASRGSESLLTFPTLTPGILFIRLIAPLIIPIAPFMVFCIIEITPFIPAFTAPPIAFAILVPSDEKVFFIVSHKPAKNEPQVENTFLQLSTLRKMYHRTKRKRRKKQLLYCSIHPKRNSPKC